jgi:hypothetical protein
VLLDQRDEVAEVLGLGAHGVQQDQRVAASTGEVAQPAARPGRVEEVAAHAGDGDSGFGVGDGRHVCLLEAKQWTRRCVVISYRLAITLVQ